MMRSSDMMRIFQRVVHMVRPAIQTNVSNETGNISRMQAKFNDVDLRELNHMQLTGFASSTPVGTDLMILNVAGDNSNGVVVASNHQQYRPKNLATGETAIYDCQQTQQSIALKADGTVVVSGFHNVTVSCDTIVTITAPTVKVVGNLQVTGSVTAGYGGGDQVGLQSHKHGTGTAAAGTSVPTAGS